MDISFASAVVILLLVTDPLGNIPVFVSLLRGVDEKRRARVIVRECLVALAVLLLFAIFGRALLELFGLSERSLSIAGGLILFLIALHMIFRSGQDIYGEKTSGDPFIVPLAIPAIAGPAAIATVILQVSRAAGETAPILFTGAVFYVAVPDHGIRSFLPYGVWDRCMALSYHLFILSTQVTGVSESLQYGTAVVLFGIVLTVNLLSIALRVYLRSRKKW